MSAAAQQMEPRTYQIGTPEMDTLWVDPTNGNDANPRATRIAPVRTLSEAWRRIPSSMPLTRGFAIMLLPGEYPEESVPNYWESRWGSAQHPVMIATAPGFPPVTLPNVNVYDCRYFYLLNLSITGGGGDVLHFESCSYVLLRGVAVVGQGNIRNYEGPQEGLKINQSQQVYLEGCDISGATDNAVDFVGVQHGHIIDSKIHRANDWCIYLKGGSAYFRVESNEIYDGGTGGFTAGQGTGFQFMTSPWIHYEAYDLKIINNIIHDTEGAALGVQGGYNILMAHNTCYRIGSRSHLFEAVFGGRSCDGQPGENGRGNCAEYLSAGGWGTTAVDDGSNYIRIPNRNVFIYNNIFYNPAGFQSQYQHFTIFGPFAGNPAESNAPNPAVADQNLQIRGNVIWDGPQGHSLGLGDESGCQNNNPTCNQAQLLAENSINTIEPQLINPATLDFRPVPKGTLWGVATYPIPDFPGGDRQPRPLAPAGNLSNIIARDYTGATRAGTQPPGAHGLTAASGAHAWEAPATPGIRARYNANGTITIDLPEPQAKAGRVLVADASGRQLLAQSIPPGVAHLRLLLPDLPPGKFFCTVIGALGTITIPVLVTQ
ncbi:MAG: right-handed parallel beta-helix repeat-containing protein [Candidatus Kapabacteria bacterium]|nr:right-handed parallel beta-helix repeat-containing protein [Candidatus Kapabacteria bacterium]